MWPFSKSLLTALLAEHTKSKTTEKARSLKWGNVKCAAMLQEQDEENMPRKVTQVYISPNPSQGTCGWF